MDSSKHKFANVDEYISMFPKKTQIKLQQVRATIKKAAPQAEEIISYNLPAYKQNGMLVFFAAYKNHIGFYPTGSGIQAFQKEIKDYKSSKGAVQFPIDEPLPLNLITKIVKFKMKENFEKASAKTKKKTA